MTLTKTILVVLALLLCCNRLALGQDVPGVTSDQQPQVKRPNVILIFADDLGPGLLGCYGQQVIETPNIDRLAQQGMKFTNYYGAVYCAPARWTLLHLMRAGLLKKNTEQESKNSNQRRIRSPTTKYSLLKSLSRPATKQRSLENLTVAF